MTDEIYHELHEDLRQQKLRAFWAENGAWIIGTALAAIVLTAGLSWWRVHAESQNKAATARLLAAQEAGDPQALADLAQDTKANRALFAHFAEARLHAGRGESEKAAAAFKAAAEVKGADSLWRDLARLYAVMQTVDTGEPAALHAALAPLADDKAPWRWSAREMQAVLFYREGKVEETRKTLDLLLSDPDTPQGLRARATALRDQLPVEKEGK